MITGEQGGSGRSGAGELDKLTDQKRTGRSPGCPTVSLSIRVLHQLQVQVKDTAVLCPTVVCSEVRRLEQL